MNNQTQDLNDEAVIEQPQTLGEVLDDMIEGMRLIDEGTDIEHGMDEDEIKIARHLIEVLSKEDRNRAIDQSLEMFINETIGDFLLKEGMISQEEYDRNKENMAMMAEMMGAMGDDEDEEDEEEDGPPSPGEDKDEALPLGSPTK